MPLFRVIATDGVAGDEPVLLADSAEGAAQGYRDLGGTFPVVDVVEVTESG